MENKTINKKGIIAIIAFFALVFITVTIIYLIKTIPRHGTVEVTIKYAPFSSTVKLGDKTLKNNDVNYIKPGEYELTASLDGFETITQTVTINEATTLYGSLVPNTKEGEDTYNKNTRDYKSIEEYYANELIKQGIEDRNNWPIIKKLPFKNTLFSLGYVIQDNNIIISVNATETYLNNAISKLISFNKEGDLLKYEIQYKKFTNPFLNNFKSNSSSDPLTFLTTGYSGVSKEHSFKAGGYLDNKNYYYATATTGNASHYNLVSYKVLLKKSGNSWKLISAPQPIITTKNAPDVSEDILKTVNGL